jgi:hypothetical protein
MVLPVRLPSASAILLLVAACACALRLSAFIGAGGPLGAPTGYDDGVYFSASALFTRGLLPYRDFVFVHPPGILYALAPVSWWPDPAVGFPAARMLSSLLGGLSALLAGTIVLRLAGPAPGVVAATLYAIYPDALVAEQSTFIEPVLNVLVLASALVWLDDRQPIGGRRALLAGGLCGAACVAKLWGGIWLVAALAAAPRDRAAAARFLSGAVGAAVILLAPVALPATTGFLEQILSFQFMRPPDGSEGSLSRLREMAGSDHRAATVLSVVAVGSMGARLLRGRPDLVSRGERYFGVAMLLTVLGLLVAPTYWRHYNAHLAASQCVLAGFGVAAVLRMRWPSPVAAAAAVAATVVALDSGSVPRALQHSRARSPELLATRAGLRELAPAGGSVFVFDPAWGLVAGRLPEYRDKAPVVLDSYAVMLLDALRPGDRFVDTTAAFESSAPQPTIRARLDASDAVMLGWRGTWQLNDADGAWFASRFECRNPEAGELCVWTRRSAPALERLPIEEQFIQFDDGWYDAEGIPPQTWRWMAERAVVRLPARRGAMRLEMAFEVPLTEIGRTPSVVIELDGQEIARVEASAPVMAHAFEVETDSVSPHVLVIRSDASFTPALSGLSSDTRSLALKLRSLTWTRASGAGPPTGPT